MIPIKRFDTSAFEQVQFLEKQKQKLRNIPLDGNNDLCSIPGTAYWTETEPGKMLARYTVGLPSHGLCFIYLSLPFLGCVYVCMAHGF